MDDAPRDQQQASAPDTPPQATLTAPPPPPQADRAEELLEQAAKPATPTLTDPMAAAAARIVNGASWFYWIAGLSVVNCIIAMFHGKWILALGLGITMGLDAFAQEMHSTGGKVGLLLITLALAGLFWLFGKLASKASMGAFITGLTIYSLDTLIFLAAGDWLGVILHGWAIFSIFAGVRACAEFNRLRKAAATVPSGPPANLPPPPPQYNAPPPPPEPPTSDRTE